MKQDGTAQGGSKKKPTALFFQKKKTHQNRSTLWGLGFFKIGLKNLRKS